MPKRTTKKSLYKAKATEAIAARAALVEAIGAAEEKYDAQLKVVADAQAKLDALTSDVATAYDDAVDGGWTAAELKDLGIARPAAKPSKPVRSSGPKKPSDDPADDISSNTADPQLQSTLEHNGSQPSPTPEPAYQ